MKWNIEVNWVKCSFDNALVIRAKIRGKKMSLANDFLVLFFASISSTFRDSIALCHSSNPNKICKMRFVLINFCEIYSWQKMRYFMFSRLSLQTERNWPSYKILETLTRHGFLSFSCLSCSVPWVMAVLFSELRPTASWNISFHVISLFEGLVSRHRLQSKQSRLQLLHQNSPEDRSN